MPPATTRHALVTENGITIEVESPCIGQARRLCTDFSLALEYGAVPAAQARMIEAVHEAEDKNFPVSCLLSFGA